MKRGVHFIVLAIMSIAVVATVLAGLSLVGSPATARARRIDQERLEDMRRIARVIDELCHDRDVKTELKRPLPATLEGLAGLARTERIGIADPVSNEPYSYKVSGTTYTISATFENARDLDYQVFWNHPAGNASFTIDALDPPASIR